MKLKLMPLVAALLVALVACGSENATEPTSAGGAPTPESAYPVTIGSGKLAVTIEERPESIVSLSATSTEMLFAIDAGDQVEAVDDQSNYPPEAPTTDLSGFEPNVEAIASYDPDLVIISGDPGDLVKSLEQLDITVLTQPAAATLDDTYQQIADLGDVTGHVEEADEVVEGMKADIDEIVASVPEDTDATYFHELDNTYFTATSETFIGQVYSLLGLENIADAAPKAQSGYLQLSEEYIIDADPDLIFLADTKCCDQTAETVAKRPGWDHIAAVKNDGVVELDDDIASRWGPRIVDYLRTVADAVTELES